MSLNPVILNIPELEYHNSSYNNEGMSIDDVNNTNKEYVYI